mgnify:CR=1 FL=1
MKIELYLFYAFITFMLIEKLIKVVIPYIPFIYILVALGALIKDMSDFERIRAGEEPYALWFKHTGILIALIAEALYRGLFAIPFIAISLALMFVDIVIDVYQDLMHHKDC